MSSNAGCSGIQNLLAIISTARHSLDLSSFGPSVKHYEDAFVAHAMQHTWIRGAAHSFFQFAGNWNSRDINDAVSVYKNVILQQKRSEGKNCIHVTMQHNMTKNACFATRGVPSADAFVVFRCSCPDSCLFPFCAAPANEFELQALSAEFQYSFELIPENLKAEKCAAAMQTIAMLQAEFHCACSQQHVAECPVCRQYRFPVHFQRHFHIRKN